MKCLICNTEIEGRYWIDAWQQTICGCHKVEYCSSCGSFVKPTDLHLDDGRCLCSFCKPSVVSLPRHIEWVDKRVRFILTSHGIDDLPKEITIKIINPVEMAKLNGSGRVSLLQPGLTCTSRTVGMFGTRCNHTIYMFDHLPKIKFAGVLAHEMLHTWLHEKNISLPPMLTEGFCNLGSYVVYVAINTEISKCLINSLEEDTDPIYGDGFRKVLGVYRNVGSDLKKVMKVIRQIK